MTLPHLVPLEQRTAICPHCWLPSGTIRDAVLRGERAPSSWFTCRNGHVTIDRSAAVAELLVTDHEGLQFVEIASAADYKPPLLGGPRGRLFLTKLIALARAAAAAAPAAP